MTALLTDAALQATAGFKLQAEADTAFLMAPPLDVIAGLIATPDTPIAERT